MGKAGAERLPEECESTDGKDAFEDAIEAGSVLVVSRGDDALRGSGGGTLRGASLRNATEIIR